MDKKEKILGMLQLLDMNDDLFCYEMTSLATKINNFLDDRSRLVSGQWLDVMYVSLTDEGADETAEMDADDVFVEAEIIHFQGTGYDEEDGQINPSYLFWYSNIDGALGTGTSFNISTLFFTNIANDSMDLFFNFVSVRDNCKLVKFG